MPKIEVPPEFAAWSRVYILAFQAATRGSVISLDSSSELAFAARDAGERAGKAQLEAEQRGECSKCSVAKTDQETIAAMLTASGVPFKLLPALPEYRDFEAMISVTVDEDERGKVRGYANFISCFYFDANGKLITMGVWK